MVNEDLNLFSMDEYSLFELLLSTVYLLRFYFVTISLTCVTFLLVVWLVHVPCVPLCVHSKNDGSVIEIIQVIVSVKPFGTFVSSSKSIITLDTPVFCGVFLHTYSCSWKFLVNAILWPLTNTEDLAFYNWQLANCRFLLNVAMHLYSIPYLLFVFILKFYFHICLCIYFRYIFMWIFIIFQTWKFLFYALYILLVK